MKKLLPLLLLFPIILFSQKSPDLQSIIDRHAEVMGGKENWRNFKTHVIVHEMEVKGKKATSTLTMKMPNKFRIDFETEGSNRIKSYDGKEGWILLNNELKEMPEGEDKEMAEEAEFYGELVLAQERGHQLDLLGKEKLNGKKVFKIKMTKSATDEQFYYVNAENYLLEMVSEHSEDVSWKGTEFKTTFDDYRLVDGLLFPFKMGLYANDELMRNYITTEIKVNVPVDDQIFNKDFNLIKRNATLFSKALMESDYDAVVNAYTDDGKIFPNNQKILSGHEALRKYWTPPPGSKNRITYHKVTPEEVEIIGDTANDFGYYEGRSIGNDGNENSWKGKYVIVWKEVKPDVWKMYLDIWNSVRD